MRSHQKLAMTSVAYAVTLLTVAAVTGLEFSTASKAEAVSSPPSTSVTATTLSSAKITYLEQLSASVKEGEHLLVAKPGTKAKAKEPAIVTKSSSLKASNQLDQYIGLKTPLTGKQLSHLLYHTGFRGEAHRLAWGIVMRESNARPKALNDSTKTADSSYGIFQINMYGSLGQDRLTRYELASYADLYDPVVNARVAFLMSGRGTDFGAWGIGPNAYKPGADESTLRLKGYPGIIITLSK